VGLYTGTNYLLNVKTAKSPHAILDINEERRKWSFGSKTNAKNAWGLPAKGNQNFLLALINTNMYVFSDKN
jgi:hypothetical protein